MADHIVDLSIPFDESIPRWKVKFEAAYNTNCYKITTIHMSVHTATHIDSPLHYVPGEVSIVEFPLEWTFTEAIIVDLSHVSENYSIGVKDLEPYFSCDYPKAVIIRTDWTEKYWGTMKFWEVSPYISEDAAIWLAKKNLYKI